MQELRGGMESFPRRRTLFNASIRSVGRTTLFPRATRRSFKLFPIAARSLQSSPKVRLIINAEATVPAPIPRNTRKTMAEGARFELADPLRGLQFSRLARSAAPSPLRAKNHRTSMVKRQVYEKKNFTIVLEYEVAVLVLRLCDLR